MLGVYAAAIAAMRQRPAHEPTSWWFQSAIHSLPQQAGPGDDPAWGTLQLADLQAIFTPPAGADAATIARFGALQGVALGTPIGDVDRAWVTCPHHTEDRTFLAWHRLYLVLFERTVEAVALEIGTLSPGSTFALPYWNYLTDPVLPAAFRNTASPLFNPRRNPSANAGQAIIDSLALDGTGTDFPGGWPVAGASTSLLTPGGFSDILESAPHDTVHGRIGGWMGGVPRAARDPIFWLHHAQIDRLWESWRQAVPGADPTSANPTGQAWLDTPLRFVTPEGAPDNRQGSDVLDTKALGYHYEELEPAGAVTAAAAAGPVPAASAAGDSPIAAAPQPVEIGEATVRVPLAAAAPTPGAVPAASPERVVLRLSGIRAASPPETDFDVFVERRGAQGEPVGQPLGRINLFGRIHSSFGHAHGAAPEPDQGTTVAIDVTRRLAEAGLSGAAPGDLIVTIRPNGPPSTTITIEKIELVGR
jgi:tyrosinase